jgi:hypothetical protein
MITTMPRLEGSTRWYAAGNSWEENVVSTPLAVVLDTFMTMSG